MELLDQADALLELDYVSAAMVTAGGALEITVRHVCESAAPPIQIEGHGSIEKYNTAIAQRRKTAPVPLDLSHTKLVTAWGGLRNDATHDPLSFGNGKKHTKDSIAATVLQIRGFLAALA